jgi:hypothetical protein
VHVDRFNYRIGDLEVRSCNGALLADGLHVRAAIFQFSKDSSGREYCWVVAAWNESEEGFSLAFIGERPLNLGENNLAENDSNNERKRWLEFRELIEVGQRRLDAAFEISRN